MLTERDIVEAIARRALGGAGVEVGVGDDAAVLSPAFAEGEQLVVSSDTFVEGIHFIGVDEAAGWRAVHAALSDLAAMGATARWVLVDWAVRKPEHALSLLDGVVEATRSAGAALVGGDTVRTPGPATVSVTALGTAVRPLLRRGARPGDALWLTGALGDAGAGLWLLQHRPSLGDRFAPLVERYRRPRARLRAGAALGQAGVRAAIDVSDGLLLDAARLARASGVQVCIEARRLPLSRAFVEWAPLFDGDPTWFAMTAGDDYELLVAAPPESALEAVDVGAPITRVGYVEEGEAGAVYVASPAGQRLRVPPAGWDAFVTP